MSLFFMLATLVIWAMSALSALWFSVVFPVLATRMWTILLPLATTVFILLGISFTRTHYGVGTDFLYYAAYILFGFVFLAFCISFFFAAVYWLLGFFHVESRAWLGPISAAVLFIVCVLSLWGGFSTPKLKKIPVTLPTLPKLKIAILSDSHLGRGVSLARFDKALSKLEAEKPDVLLVLGDVFEYGKNQDAYAERINHFQAPLGKYGVFGNHEYYVGYQNSKNFFDKAGISLLENEITSLSNGVQVAGLKDIKTVRVTPQEVKQLLAQADKQRPLILLSHTPSYTEEAAAQGASLMFSGHTHNGQIWPFNYLVRLQFPRVYGLFDVNGMQFYITSGMFYWGMPLRFLAPAELPIIEVN